jgi:hypothetical protein
MRLLRSVRKWEGRLRHFFQKNVTGFTYLFFAQTIFIAQYIFWQYIIEKSAERTLILSFPAGYFIVLMLLYSLIPITFVLGALLTFHYPSNKEARNFFIFFIITLTIISMASAIPN